MGDIVPKPTVQKTVGQRPACLVNASITYCGNNQIYAFGGFDQYTDEGMTLIGGNAPLAYSAIADMYSLQPRATIRSDQPSMELG